MAEQNERPWVSRIWHKGQGLPNGAMDRADSWRAWATLQSPWAKKGRDEVKGGVLSNGDFSATTEERYAPPDHPDPSYFTPAALATAF